MRKVTPKQKQRLRKLINALTNNKYKQGVELLYNTTTTEWCWGGVAIDIYFNDTHQGYWEAKENSKYGVATITQTGEKYKVHVPIDVLNWYGLTLEEHNMLTDMNDTEHTFKQIATAITKEKLKDTLVTTTTAKAK